MKIVWIKILEVVATTVLPVAVDLLVNFLRKKVSDYEKATPISV